MPIANSTANSSKRKRDDYDKPNSSPYTNLQIVKDKLSCREHSGKKKWCWIDSRSPNEHIPLCLNDIQLWAQFLGTSKDTSCTVLPATMHFAELSRSRKPRTKALTRAPTEPVDDHEFVSLNYASVNVPSSSVSEFNGDFNEGEHQDRLAKGVKKARVAMRGKENVAPHKLD